MLREDRAGDASPDGAVSTSERELSMSNAMESWDTCSHRQIDKLTHLSCLGSVCHSHWFLTATF